MTGGVAADRAAIHIKFLVFIHIYTAAGNRLIAGDLGRNQADRAIACHIDAAVSGRGVAGEDRVLQGQGCAGFDSPLHLGFSTVVIGQIAKVIQHRNGIVSTEGDIAEDERP